MFVHLLAALLLLSPMVSQEDKKENKIDGKLLIGKWSPEKLQEGLDKLVIEYAKEDKLTITITAQGETRTIEGTYKLTGDKLNIKFEIEGEKRDDKRTIIKLTQDEFVSRDEEMKIDRVFKRVK